MSEISVKYNAFNKCFELSNVDSKFLLDSLEHRKIYFDHASIDNLIHEDIDITVKDNLFSKLLINPTGSYIEIDFHYIFEYLSFSSISSFFNNNSETLNKNTINWKKCIVNNTIDYNNPTIIAKAEIFLPLNNPFINLIYFNKINSQPILDTSFFNNNEYVVKFIFIYKLNNIITKYFSNLDESLKSYSESFTCCIKQIYNNSHDLDNYIINNINCARRSYISIPSDIKRYNKFIDLPYIIRNLKYANLKLLDLFNNLFTFNRRTIFKDPEIKYKEKDVFDALKFKFSKYILNNNHRANFIKSYRNYVN